MSAAMELDVINIDGDHHRITIMGHDVDVDQPVADGGGDAGPTPTALFVASLAACVAHFARRGLGRGGPGPHVHCTWDMSTERPHRVTSIDIEVRLPAETPPERVAAVARAVGHCTVHNSIVQAPSINVATSLGEPVQPRAA